MPTDRESRRLAQEAVVEAMSTHTAWQHRASTAQSNAMNRIVTETGTGMARELAERLDNLTPAELSAFTRGRYTTSRLEGLRKLIDGWIDDLSRRLDEMNVEALQEFAGYEAGFARRLVDDAVVGAVAAAPAASSVYRSAMDTPVLGRFVSEMFEDIPDGTKKQVYSRLRQGISQGMSNGEIMRQIRGTRALKYKDGVLQWTRNEVDNLVRTARGHVSNVAYDETYQALGVEYVVDVATLDGRTTKYCAGIDGRRHKVGTNHPRPPYHHRCRTVQAPSFDGQVMGKRPYVKAFEPISQIPRDQRSADMVGQVSAITRYPAWFARQPASFQKQWLGESRYRLYKDGGYKIDRFVDPLGGELTLAELRARDADTFRRLFGT